MPIGKLPLRTKFFKKAYNKLTYQTDVGSTAQISVLEFIGKLAVSTWQKLGYPHEGRNRHQTRSK